jgi:hypothetical protein
MERGVKLTYGDDDLRKAVEVSHSWRGVMRELGYATSNGYLAMRLRHRAEELGLDLGHFPVKRIWSARELEEAVQQSTNWGDVAVQLGQYPNGANIAKLRACADRAEISYGHFPETFSTVAAVMPFTDTADERFLPTAAIAMAAAWFLRRGYGVSYPIEARPYDLVVEWGNSLYRIQVKTTRARDRNSGAGICGIKRVPRRDHLQLAYDPADVDFFFIIDVSGDYYIVPIQDVVGSKQVSLTTIRHRKVNPH